MNKNDLRPYMIVLASDQDLGIRYPNSSTKGKRYHLVTKVDLDKGVFELLYFSKGNMKRESDRRYISLDELPDSVLKLDNSPKEVSIKKVSHLTRETELSTNSVNKINEKRKELRLFSLW